ncbi:MAG: 23S rRNA (guanosine(2251)-2'-O)-methyltransferase RlmB [Alphaproteobacteria bacterium]|nr:23S rRNA (guanosine(2251)-2'-O)-methyltransferase RlmB [Alphaproteobacteria bacterium]
MAKRKRPFQSGQPIRAASTAPAGGPAAGRARTGETGPGPSGAGPAYWIYGTHAVHAALANPRRRIRRLLMARETVAGPRPPGPPQVQAEIVERTALDRAVPAGAVHQGIAVLVEPLEELDLDEVLDGLAGAQSATILLLDQVTDPQNIGAVMRSAAALGAAAVIVPRHHAPQVTGALAKAASGALEHVALVRVGNIAQAIERLKESRFWCVALEGEAGQDLAAVDLSGRVALALGAEGPGLRRLTRERCDLAARLPTAGPIAHLNVSNAAAVALYECARQRGAASKGGGTK